MEEVMETSKLFAEILDIVIENIKENKTFLKIKT